MSSLLSRLQARWTRRRAERRLKSIQSLHYLPHANPTLADRRTALLFGTAALLSPAASQAQVNPPAWQTGYMYVNGGTTVNTNIPNPTPYNLTNLNIIASANITTWNVTLPSIPFDGQVITISQGVSTVGTTNVIAPAGFTVNSTGQGAYQFITNQAKWVSVQLAAGSVTVMGLPTVATIAALAALSPATSSAYLTDSIRGGNVFNWVAGSFTTQVTNDPGQGVYVALASDPTGATGAWVRQYEDAVNLTWWGLISDPTFASAPAIAANSTALANWHIWAMYQSITLGLGVDLFVPPGFYPYDNNLCQRFLGNIQKFHMRFYGATFQNVSTNASWTIAWELASPVFLGANGSNWFINQTTIGSTAFTTVTSTDVANLTVGNFVLLGSLDIQYNGYPPNMEQCEFPKIATINQYASATPSSMTYTTSTGLLALTFSAAPFGAGVGTTLNGAFVPVSGITVTGGTAPNGTWPIVSTASAGTVITLQAPSGLLATGLAAGSLGPVGAITLDRPIRWQHLTTFPDGATASVNKCGTARVWSLNNNGGAGSIVWTWDVDHVYEGGTILGALHAASGIALSTLSMTGRSIRWINSSINGVSPTVAGKVTCENCKIFAANEPDKNVDFFGLFDCEVVGDMKFQSSSINTALTRGGSITGLLTTGAKEQTTIGCNIGSIGIGPSQGANRSSAFLGCNIRAYPNNVELFNSSRKSFTIDGTTITYSNGVITMPWTSLSPVEPGMVLQLGQSSGSGALDGYSGDLGTMIVLGITGDGTHFFIQTSSQLTSLPSWTSNDVFIKRHRDVVFQGCSGCDEVLRANVATKNGFQEWEWIPDTLAGQCSTTGFWKPFGVPVSFNVKVVQPCTVSSKTLVISGFLYTASAPATFTAFALTIDLSTVGQRIVNQSTVTLLGADTFTVNSTTATKWPAGSFVNGNTMQWLFNYTPSTLTLLQLPVVDIALEFDLGLYGNVLTSLFAQQGGGTMIALPGGNLPPGGGSLL